MRRRERRGSRAQISPEGEQLPRLSRHSLAFLKKNVVFRQMHQPIRQVTSNFLDFCNAAGDVSHLLTFSCPYATLVTMIEQYTFTPFEIDEEILAVPTPDALPTEMTVYFEDGTASPDAIETALRSLKSQIIYEWKNSFEETPPVSLAVVKKERNFIKVRISAE